MDFLTFICVLSVFLLLCSASVVWFVVEALRVFERDVIWRE